MKTANSVLRSIREGSVGTSQVTEASKTKTSKKGLDKKIVDLVRSFLVSGPIGALQAASHESSKYAYEFSAQYPEAQEKIMALQRKVTEILQGVSKEIQNNADKILKESTSTSLDQRRRDGKTANEVLLEKRQETLDEMSMDIRAVDGLSQLSLKVSKDLDRYVQEISRIALMVHPASPISRGFQEIVTDLTRSLRTASESLKKDAQGLTKVRPREMY